MKDEKCPVCGGKMTGGICEGCLYCEDLPPQNAYVKNVNRLLTKRRFDLGDVSDLIDLCCGRERQAPGQAGKLYAQEKRRALKVLTGKTRVPAKAEPAGKSQSPGKKGGPSGEPGPDPFEDFDQDDGLWEKKPAAQAPAAEENPQALKSDPDTGMRDSSESAQPRYEPEKIGVESVSAEAGAGQPPASGGDAVGADWRRELRDLQKEKARTPDNEERVQEAVVAYENVRYELTSETSMGRRAKRAFRRASKDLDENLENYEGDITSILNGNCTSILEPVKEKEKKKKRRLFGRKENQKPQDPDHDDFFDPMERPDKSASYRKTYGDSYKVKLGIGLGTGIAAVLVYLLIQIAKVF